MGASVWRHCSLRGWHGGLRADMTVATKLVWPGERGTAFSPLNLLVSRIHILDQALGDCHVKTPSLECSGEFRDMAGE
jgi:hypothetical protein